MTDKVEAAFQKHAEVLFPAEPRPFYKPKTKKKKKKKKPPVDGIELLTQN